LKGVGAWRTDFVESGVVSNSTNTIFTAVRPNGISNVTAYQTSVLDFLDSPVKYSIDNGTSCYPSLSMNSSTVSQCYRLSSIPSSGSISVVKYVGIASSDAFNGTESSTSRNTAQKANSTGYSNLLESHKQAWNDIWNSSDIVIPQEGLEELQYATRASLFHLLSNVRSGNESTGLGDNSIAPAGLTSDSYAGQFLPRQSFFLLADQLLDKQDKSCKLDLEAIFCSIALRHGSTMADCTFVHDPAGMQISLWHTL